MATKTPDKYADFRYEIIFPEELREAKWLIEQGDFKDLDDYIERMTRVHKRIMKRKDAEKRKLALAKRKKLVSTKREKAA